jgi:hypothetical protein
MNEEQYMGYELFNDVEDAETRDRNRGQVMLNIYQDHCNSKVLDAAGVAALLGYFKEVPADEKANALAYFTILCEQQGHFGSVTEH